MRVLGRLGHPGRHMGPGQERGIAQEGDASDRHAGRLDIVDRLQERSRGLSDHLLELRRQQGRRGRAQLRDDLASHQLGAESRAHGRARLRR